MSSKLQRDEGAACDSSESVSRKGDKGVEEKKPRPIREESFGAEIVFEKNDFSYIDAIVDPKRESRRGPKGYPPSALLMALLLMYLKEIKSILALIRFLTSNPEWLRILNLRRRVHGVDAYSVPDRTRFYRLARRIGCDRIVEILAVIVIRLMKKGIIKGRRVSLDCSMISSWFKDCPSARRPDHIKDCRRHRSRDKEASWGWDHHRERYVYGYKVHMLIDSSSGLPVMLTITGAGYGENRTVMWFISMIVKIRLSVRKLLADMAYDSNSTRLMIIDRLKAIPFIPLNPRNCKGSTEEEKRVRRKRLCLKFYVKNFIKRWWIDPDSKEFDDEYDSRIFSEQGFSIGKGSLNLDSLMHRGKEWTMLHSSAICMVMLVAANTAIEIGRPDLMRCVKCFSA